MKPIKPMKLKKNILAGLLAAVMTLSLAPVGLAAYDPNRCPECGSPDCTRTVIKEATCVDPGWIEYVCYNSDCPKSQKSNPVKTVVNPENHDAIFSDNGDGTHSGVCGNHKPAVTVNKERHTFSNGLCTKCRAIDYSSVRISLPENPVVYAAVDDDNAILSLSDISMTIGSADITGDYNLSYNWYYQGKLVGSEKTYTIPQTITSQKGDYKYVCFIMAVPKNSQTTQPVSASCTVTLRVQDLITAYAAVSRSDRTFSLGSRDNQSNQSVEEQIYEAVYSASDTRPDYVMFGAASSTKVGSLDVDNKIKYYFDPSNRSQYALADVYFRPSGDAAGTYTIGFSAYDLRGKEFAGLLTITVGQYSGDMDVFYTAPRDAALTLDAADFENFWLDNYSRGSLTWIRFTQLPGSAEGGLYVDYVSNTRPGTRVKTGDTFYNQPGRNQYGVNDVTFIPGAKQSGYVVIPFEAYGENNSGRQLYLDGNLYILVSDGAAAEISCRVSAGAAYNLKEADFLSVYQTVTGSRGTGFSIQFTSVPENGSLYVNYTSAGRGTRLTSSNIAGRPFYYNGSNGDLISDLTYVPGDGLTDTVRYLAYDSQGKLLYAGNVRFTVGELAVNYTSTSTGVSFKSSDFEKLIGSTGKLTTVSFTAPAATSGMLYYGRSNTSAGTTITSSSVWFGVSASASTTATVLNLNNLTFVPAANYSGVVTIPFTAYDEGGSKVSGTVRITVTATATTTPGTTTTPTAPTTPTTPTTTTPTTPTTTTPAVSFADVPNNSSTSWYYTAVMDLAAAKVIGGRDDGKFYPNDAVTYGEALKMIMLAAGYTEQAPTDKHWASGYMSRAVADKLLPQSVSPDRKISRYTIAEVAAKALKMALPTVTSSPFDDMLLSEASAPYVLALYNVGIVNGSKNEKNEILYQGTYAIRRCEIAVIIWRINNYKRTGSVDGIRQ